jgi:hypothetical protein
MFQLYTIAHENEKVHRVATRKYLREKTTDFLFGVTVNGWIEIFQNRVVGGALVGTLIFCGNNFITFYDIGIVHCISASHMKISIY